MVAGYPFGPSNHPDAAVHQFGSGNAMTEQRAFLRDVDRCALSFTYLARV